MSFLPAVGGEQRRGPALGMMDRFPLDSVLFHFNLICFARGPWPEGATKDYRKAWYQPIDPAEEPRNPVRFNLGEEVTPADSPGNLGPFRTAVTLGAESCPLTAEERAELLAGTWGMVPLFKS